eukprot:jgi/Psemu1/199917/e_gw1.247.19.1
MLSVEDIPSIFRDLTPVPQNDGPDRVCVIQYPSSFSLAYNYMRAVWEANELSERALKLSATCLKLNPANYTVWSFRRRCLGFLGHTEDPERIRADLELTAVLGGPNPKNYQIWYHRRALLETHGANAFLDEELNYIAGVLGEDAKNYHAWSYRQWIMMTVDDEDAWGRELGFVAALIEDDARNNSAWNQRWFVTHHRGGKSPLSLEEARTEATFALDAGASIDPYNESPWRYLVGVLREQQRLKHRALQGGSNDADNDADSNNDNDEEDAFRSLLADCDARALATKDVLEAAHKDPDTCVHRTSARIDLLELLGTDEALASAAELAGGLARIHDVVRRKYWTLVERRMIGLQTVRRSVTIDKSIDR